MTDTCICCGEKIIKIGNQLYCNKCSLHNWRKSKEMMQLKQQVKRLKIILYGTDDRRRIK